MALKKPIPKFGWNGQRPFHKGDQVIFVGRWDFLAIDGPEPVGGLHGILYESDQPDWPEDEKDDQCTGQLWVISFQTSGMGTETRLAFEGQLRHV